jgi:hypothetical protein
MSHPEPVDRAAMQRRRRRRRLAGIVFAIGALLAVAGLMSGPKRVRSRIHANEWATITTLRNLSRAQSQLQASVAQDADGNGSSEFGFFGELSGAAPLRNTEGTQRVPMRPPGLSAAFQPAEDGRVYHCGYVFEMWLPAVGGGWVRERDVAQGRQVDAAAAETMWLCYAWPESHGATGVRTFLINQTDDIIVSLGHARVVPFSNSCPPVPERSGFVETPTGWKLSVNTVDCKGEMWFIVA